MRIFFKIWVILFFFIGIGAKAQNGTQSAIDSISFQFDKIENLLNEWKNEEVYSLAISFLQNPQISSFQAAKLYQTLGRVHNRAGRYDSAQYYLDKTLFILEKISLRESTDLTVALVIGQAYYFAGVNSVDRGFYNIAFQQYQSGITRLLPFKQKREVGIELAGLYSALCSLYTALSNFREADIVASKAIQYANETNDTLTNILTHVTIADFYRKIQRNQDAVYLLEKALALKSLNPLHEAIIYTNLGNCYIELTDYAQALLHYQHSLDLLQDIQDMKETIGRVYVNMGLAHFYEVLNILRFDELDPSLLQQSNQYYEKAIKIFEQLYTKPNQTQATIYNNLGQNYFILKKYDEAKNYYQKALEIYDKVLINKNIDERATLYNNLGELAHTKGESKEAVFYFEEALNICKQIFGERHPKASAKLYILGQYYDDLKQTQKALEKIQEAITANFEHFTDDSPYSDIPLQGYFSATDLYNGLHKKAVLLNKLANQANPEEIQKISIQVRTLLYKADSLMLRIRNQNIRQTDKIQNTVLYDRFTAIAMYNTYQLFIQTQNKNYLYDTFYFSERGKAGVLWENLMSTQAKKMASVPDSIIRKEQILSDNIAFYEQKLLLKTTEEEKKIFQNEWRQTQFALSELIITLEKKYPQYYQIKYNSSIASVGQIQSQLDEKTALVSYSLVAAQSYVFVITQKTFDVIPIGGAETLKKIIGDYYLDLQNGRSLRSYATNAFQAYNALIKPIEAFIQEKTKLIIVAEDDLLRIPFEPLIQALPTEVQIATNDCASLKYLVHKFDIQYHYSANLWYHYQTLPYSTSKFENEFICFAPFSEEKGGKYQTRSEGYFLPESKEEVNEIYNLFLAQNKPATAYLSTAATKQNFKNSLNLGKIVHIATHSNSERKKLLAKIRFVDCLDIQQDADFSDCLLMKEIYQMRLETDLLVMSSCESGVGKLSKGEGVFSLSRAFLHAGAKNIIFSLWKVQDTNTKNLMIEFYNQLTSKNISYNTALMNAKRKIIQVHKTLHPREWCGFVMIGK